MITKNRDLRLRSRASLGDARPRSTRPIPPPALLPRIVRPTAVLIDKSAGMEESMELGRRVLEVLTPVMRANLHAYAFDTMAYGLERRSAEGGRWDAALSGLVAEGKKACGAAIEQMRQEGEYVERMVLITDQRENAGPTFVEAYQKYALAMDVRPEVCIVRPLDSSGWLEHRCRVAKVPLEVFAFDGDVKELPKLISLLI